MRLFYLKNNTSLIQSKLSTILIRLSKESNCCHKLTTKKFMYLIDLISC